MTPGLLSLIILLTLAGCLAFLRWVYRTTVRQMEGDDWEYLKHGRLDRGRWTR